MPLKRFLVQKELDDSSSDDDDYVIFSAAQIVHIYSNAKVGSCGISLYILLLLLLSEEMAHARLV